MNEDPGHQPIETELDRDIGMVGAVAIGVGTMIAAGIFVLSGLAVSKVGAAAIVSFLLAAIVAAFTAAAYGEFSSIYPESGGGYMYVSETFDTDLTYLMGWTMILGYPASAAFYLVSFSDWFHRFIYPALSIPDAIPFWLSGLAILALLVWINLRGTEESSQFQIVVTALKVGLIILFLFGGLQALDPSIIAESMTENITQLRNIGLTSALVFITFFGFSAIATNAEEIESPGSTIPRAIYFSMGFVTVIYTLVVLVVVIAVNDLQFLNFLAGSIDLSGVEAAREFVGQNGEVSMGLAAQYYLGPFGFWIVIVGALFSMLSAANATIMAGSRVKLAMARRDHLPRGFEDLHPKLNTPYKTVLLTGGFILAYVLIFSVIFGESPGAESTPPFGLHLGLEALAGFANFLLLSGLTIVNVAVIASRRRFPDLERPFTVPAVPWVPAIAVVANVGLLFNVEPRSFAVGVVAELIGIGLWFGYIGRAPSLERIERETPTALAEYTSPGRDYRVVVPLANPSNVDQLMRTACTLAADHDGEVIVTSVVTVPDQTPLSDGRQLAGQKRAVLDQAIAFAEARDVPVSGTVRIGHHAADGILNTLVQHDANAVILGWRGSAHGGRDVVFGSTVDRVIRDADCDVYVEKIGPAAGRDVESILLPTAGGPHAELAAETAKTIARSTGARLHVINVVPPDADAEDRQRAEALVDRTVVDLAGFEVSTELVENSDVTDGIVSRTGEHDLTIIGATREGPLQRLLFGAIPQAVGQRAENTVIMTKRNLDVASRLADLLNWIQGQWARQNQNS
jgi:amino acid transporter